MLEATERRSLIIAGLLIAAGSLLFLAGGAFHPKAGPNLGPLGSDQYWQAFAAEVAHHPNWGPIHARILAGPLLWALGAVGLATAFRRRGAERAADLALITFGMAGALWSVAFVVDGWLAPRHAQAMLEAADPTLRAVAAHGFQVNQDLVVRTGLVSWLLFALGIGTLALGARRAGLWGRTTDRVVAVTGTLLALSSFALWASGEFVPGPFTSAYWTQAAVTTALWMLLFGGIMIAKAPREPQ